MHIANIKNFDTSNGVGIGVSVFVSGCHFHCDGCFNEEAWNFDYGDEYDADMHSHIMKLLANEHIDHLSLLGGEPLAHEHLDDVMYIIADCRARFPDKKVWLWTGYRMEELDDRQKEIAAMCDYVTYGRFVLSMRDITRKYSGSANQYTISHDGTIIEDGTDRHQTAH